MTRALTAALVLALAGPAAAQDMPLAHIIPDGRGWEPAAEPPPTGGPSAKVTAKDGTTYAVREGERAVTVTGPDGTARKHEVPLAEPAALALWAGDGTLVVADAGGRHLWAFPLGADGSLRPGQPYYAPRVRKGVTRGEAADLALDETGRLFAATSEGVQVFDPTGRLCGVLLKPGVGPLTRVWFGGPEGKTLFAACGGKVYGRPVLARGLRPGR